MWMEEALRLVEKEGEAATANKEDAIEFLAFSLYKQGNLKHALKWTEQLYKLSEYFFIFFLFLIQIPPIVVLRAISNGMKICWREKESGRVR